MEDNFRMLFTKKAIVILMTQNMSPDEKNPVQRPSFRPSHNVIYVFGGQIDFQVSVAYGLVPANLFLSKTSK